MPTHFPPRTRSAGAMQVSGFNAGGGLSAKPTKTSKRIGGQPTKGMNTTKPGTLALPTHAPKTF